MASLTVRQLDEKLKKLLRLRAARHGRSMEDEVRTILREAADETGREMNAAIADGDRDGLGMGEAYGRKLDAIADERFAGRGRSDEV